MRRVVENRRERLALVEDAGMGRLSVTSVLAGVLVGYGAFAVLAGVTAAVLRAVNIDVDLQGDDVARAGTVSAVVLGVVLLASYLFGGYTAGRMARRAGMTHGVVVFGASLLLAVGAAAIVEASGATGEVVEGLRRLGVPGSGEQWRELGPVAGLASLVGMLLGSLMGGVLGERWHSKLMARALDPGVGPEAVAASTQVKAARAAQRRREAGAAERDDDDGDEATTTALTPGTGPEHVAETGGEPVAGARGPERVAVAAGPPGGGSRSGASTRAEHSGTDREGNTITTATRNAKVDPKERNSAP